MSKKNNPVQKRAYYLKNKEMILSKCKAYYQANKTEIKAQVRKYILAKKYFPGLTPDQAQEKYDSMYTDQKGLCAICDKPECKIDRQGGVIPTLAVDHNHSNLIVRGLLCFQCNTKLGWYEDHTQKIKNYLGKA